MNKVVLGIISGIIAGIIDVIPMILQKLTWDANLSAFSMWVVVGFFISVNSLKLNGVLKGIITAFLTAIPCLFIIGWKEPFTLIPISIMTLILGSSLGFIIDKFGKTK